jgi:hypothetical protein
MSYEIRVSETSVVEVVHTGRMLEEEVNRAREELSQIMSEGEYRLLLADISNASIEGSTSSVYRFNASHYGSLPGGTRIAVLASGSSANSETLRFCENVAVNRGVLMRMFQSRDDAMAWLMGMAADK